MPVENKYELLEEHNATSTLAIQRRLGREVVIHRFAKSELSKTSLRELRKTVAQLSRLDHLAIPHLIDFVKLDDAYWVVFESHKPSGKSTSGDLIDELSDIGQLTEALVHAKQHGIFHGNLRGDRLIVDNADSVHVLDLGLSQLSHTDSRTTQQLAASDVTRVCELISRRLNQRLPANTESSNSVDADLVRQTGEVESLIADAKSAPTPSIESLHDKLSQWLAVERNAREAKKLSFDEEPSGEKTRRFSTTLTLLVAITGTATLVLGLTAFLLWPTGELASTANVAQSTSEDSNSISSQRHSRATAGPARSLDDFAPPGSVQPPGEEPIAAGDIDASKATPPADEETMAPSTTASTEEVASTTEEPPQNEIVASEKPKERTESPFAECGTKVALPSTDIFEWVAIAQTTLADEESLEIELLGGSGAYKQGEFQINGSAGNWSLSFVDDDASREVARLIREGSELKYQWIEADKKNTAVQAHAANTLLKLRSDTWTHAIALREYQALPAIRVNLDRKKPYELRIDQCPKFDDMVIEFVAVEGALTAVLGQKGIIKTDEKLQIALDANENSLFAIQVEPRFKYSKQNLYVKGFGRPVANAKFSPLKRNYGAMLSTSNRNAAMAIPRLKAAKEAAKDEQEKLIARRIKVLEVELKSLEKLSEAYGAAINNKLQFKIYRQIGPHQVPLVQIGNN